MGILLKTVNAHLNHNMHMKIIWNVKIIELQRNFQTNFFNRSLIHSCQKGCYFLQKQKVPFPIPSYSTVSENTPSHLSFPKNTGKTCSFRNYILQTIDLTNRNQNETMYPTTLSYGRGWCFSPGREQKFVKGLAKVVRRSRNFKLCPSALIFNFRL